MSDGTNVYWGTAGGGGADSDWTGAGTGSMYNLSDNIGLGTSYTTSGRLSIIHSDYTTGIWVSNPGHGIEVSGMGVGYDAVRAEGQRYGIYATGNTYAGYFNEASTSQSYVLYATRSSSNYGAGRATIYGYRPGTSGDTNGGSAYSSYSSDNGVKGYTLWGNNYSFGVGGFNYNDYTRCGGTIGANSSATYWGSLGYKNSSSSSYGGYFTSYTTGSGLLRLSEGGEGGMDGDAHSSIGIGAWGDLFGSEIHGAVYGEYVEGGRYAHYAHGDRYTDGNDIHLIDNGSEERTVAHTVVSEQAKIYADGTARLSSGRASVLFSEDFRNVIDTESPVTVTITPIGECNGIHLVSRNANGFTVAENGGGSRDIEFTWIAIGRRADEISRLPAEVISRDYNDKIARGLHNDNNISSDGEGLYFQNGELIVGKHSSMLPDPQVEALKRNFSEKPETRTYDQWKSDFESLGVEIPIAEDEFNSIIE